MPDAGRAEPDLSVERQHREREVIHAEFIAWSRDDQAQRQFALLQRVSPRHPLSRFHAGNRYSLAVQDPAFQRALLDFHARFYRGSHIHLSLCGPQSLDALEALARPFANLFAEGPAQAQQPPPALLDAPCVEHPATAGCLELLFAHDALPPGAAQALELLLSCLHDSRPGSWLDALRQRGWLQDVHSETLYAFAGQVLWHIRLHLSDDAPPAEVRNLLHGWLGSLRHSSATRLNDEFGRLQPPAPWIWRVETAPTPRSPHWTHKRSRPSKHCSQIFPPAPTATGRHLTMSRCCGLTCRAHVPACPTTWRSARCCHLSVA